MKQYSFLLNFGYAEDSHLGFIPFISDKKFPSATDAFIDLAKFLAALNPDDSVSECCKNNTSNFCPNCGSPKIIFDFDFEYYSDYFSKMFQLSTLDSYNSLLNDPNEYQRWEPILPKNLSKSYSVYEAEKCLAVALGYSPDKKINIDLIFDRLENNSIFYYK